MSNKPTEILDNGTKIWKNSEGRWHRDYDLPAVVWSDGSCTWYQNDKYHRDSDLPAYIDSNGYSSWWKNDKRHRDNDLPALIWPDGKCEWWVNGELIKRKVCTKEEIKEYKKPYYKQKRFKFNRFKKLIK